MDDQGVEEVLFAVGESFVQLLGALGPRARSVASSSGAARACTTSPTEWTAWPTR
jgi:hypothetical protein